jgi:hypothetical protein
MTRLELNLIERHGSRPLGFEVKRLVNAGYAGRDQEAVRRHIQELEKEGIAPPDSVPAFYALPRTLVTCADRIEVVETSTSGEVEFVVLVDEPDLYIGIGSDHTDRRLEASDVLKSKQACPNVLGRDLWNYAELRPHWDRLEMSSWVRREAGGEWTRYQAGSLAMLLSVERLLQLVSARMTDGTREGLVVFSGTLPLLDGAFVCGTEFRGELVDPVLRRSIGCRYAIDRLNYLKAAEVATGV